MGDHTEDDPRVQRLDIDASQLTAPFALDALTVLVVEDGRSDQRRILDALIEAGARPDRVTCVPTLREARQAIAERPVSCVLLDLSLPDASGLEGVTMLAAAAPDTPVVVVDGRPGGSVAYAAMAEGADEHLRRADLEPRLLQDVIARATQRRRGADRHRQALASAASVFESISAPISVIDGSGRIIAVNQAWTRSAELGDADPTRTGVGVNYLAVCDLTEGQFAEGAAVVAAGIRGVLAGDLDTFTVDYPCHTADRERWVSLRVSPSGERGGGAVLIHLDITDLKLAELAAMSHDALLSGALDVTSPIFALIGIDGAVMHLSPLTQELLSLEAGERIGADAFSMIEPSDRAEALEVFARVTAVPGCRERARVRALDGAGRWRDLDLTVTNLLDDPRVAAIAVTGSDVTDTRLHQIARRLGTRLLALLPVAISLTDDSGIIVYWNERAEELYGYAADDVLGRNVADLGLDPHDPANAEVAQAVRRDGVWEGDARGRRADGSTISLHVLLERIDDDEIGFHGVVYATFDNTERERLESELEFQAYHDALTGLPNRRLFVEHLDAVLADHEHRDRAAAVTFIDLDDFKALNDRVGHSAGDVALQVIAGRLKGALRPGDLVARLGGDEFVIGFADLHGSEEAVAVAERVLDAVRAPFRLGHHQAQVSATIGVAMSKAGLPADSLLRNADAAMYEAKDRGKDKVWLFDDELQQQTRARRERAETLQQAITAGHIHARFQPQTCLETGELVGFEALARWDRGDDATAATADFIELAEESGVVDQIDRLVLADACRALAAFHALQPEGTPTVAVNVSAQLLVQPAFPALVRELVEEAGFPARLLCIEVVESALADEDAAAASIRQLDELGVEIAIDDFGTGYSSLSRLQRFHVDYLKIDRVFVAGMADADDDAAIVSAVIGLARALNLRTVAEGVEERGQRDRLASLGVDIGQGFLWAAAVPLEHALELVRAAEPTGTPCRAPVD